MKKTKPSIFFHLVFIGFVLAPHWGLAETTNRIVAKVNDDIITLHELNASIKSLTGLSCKDLKLKDKEKYHEIRRAILENLVNKKITEQQITKLGIKVTTKQVDEAIEKVKRENNITQEELVESLKSDGITLKEYREKIQKEIERFQVVNYEVKSKIVISEEDIKKYYQLHSKEYEEVSQVRLARIFLRVKSPGDKEEINHIKSSGLKILQNLEQGNDFSELARKYSQGPASQEGGHLGWIKTSQLEPVLRKTINKLSVGEHTDLLSAPSGFQIIKLIEKKEGGIKPFEEVRDTIHSKLFKERVEKRYAMWLNELRKESFIKLTF
ncbi:MAG: peptidylprolyl isomerase [Thermodesulfobacteriota bacterium]